MRFWAATLNFPIDMWVVDTKRGPLLVGLPTRDVVLGGNPPCHSLCPLLWSLGDQHVGDQMMMIIYDDDQLMII